MRNLISGEKIVKTYGEGSEKNTVLNSVSVTVAQGEFVAVMGPSGSGKTTLMYSLGGMDGISGGEVQFDGEPLGELKEDALADLRRRRMGFVFQQPTLLKNLNLLDNIVLPALRDNRKKGVELAKRAEGLMAKMGIGDLAKRGTTQVSGGQLQRAGICRALMGSPDILFGDEPTGALNSKSAGEIMDIIAGIHGEGTAMMLVTHDAKVAARAQRVLFMRDGEIVRELRFEEDEPADMDSRFEQVAETMREIEI
ncbi:MAG: ABC transporter ATP-binding protein [Oscillospiraceae bacterium]